MAYAVHRKITQARAVSDKRKGIQRPTRRRFEPDYKLAILTEWERCSSAQERSALLRREGLYSSLLTDWRRQRREGSLQPTPGRTEEGRGGPSKSEVERLRAENDKLKEELSKAKFVIEVQGKVHALLEDLSKSAEDDNE